MILLCKRLLKDLKRLENDFFFKENFNINFNTIGEKNIYWVIFFF